MSKSPYDQAPDLAFWSRSVTSNWTPESLVSSPLLRPTDVIASAGSCFAANLVPYIEQAGFRYLRTDRRPSLFQVPPDNFGYENFSANYGNIYTARQLLQLFLRATGSFNPQELFWEESGDFIDPFRPGLRYRARSFAEFKKLTEQHLACVHRVFAESTVFIFTLGLTEAWISALDGAVFPACPGTVAGIFDHSRHRFHNFTVAEVVSDLSEFVVLARTLNPSLRIVLTVSPVPLVATATGKHVLEANTYSKSVLRVAARELSQLCPDISYFPAYEIITGPQAPHDFFAADRRSVSQKGVNEVMRTFLARCTPGITAPVPMGSFLTKQLAQSFIQAECEELLADK